MSQDFDNNALDFQQKRFYRYGCMSEFGKLEKEFPSKEKFYSCLTSKKNSEKEYERVLNKFKIRTMKDYDNLCLKYDVLLFYFT